VSAASLPDEAVVCAAIEREIARWAVLRETQGSKPPGCTPASYIDFLYGRSTPRAAAALRRMEKAGLVKRARFDTGGNGWKLTRRGTALAQEATPPCRDCLEPALPWNPPRRQRSWGRRYDDAESETYDRCAPCLAEMLDERAQDEEGTAEHWREVAEEHADRARRLRARADELRDAGVEGKALD
jgi:hypothetical protein